MFLVGLNLIDDYKFGTKSKNLVSAHLMIFFPGDFFFFFYNFSRAINLFLYISFSKYAHHCKEPLVNRRWMRLNYRKGRKIGVSVNGLDAEQIGEG